MCKCSYVVGNRTKTRINNQAGEYLAHSFVSATEEEKNHLNRQQKLIHGINPLNTYRKSLMAPERSYLIFSYSKHCKMKVLYYTRYRTVFLEAKHHSYNFRKVDDVWY